MYILLKQIYDMFKTDKPVGGGSFHSQDRAFLKGQSQMLTCVKHTRIDQKPIGAVCDEQHFH